MMKITIVLCGILCASATASLYYPVEESTELREYNNAMLNMTIAHITTIYGQYISWVEHIARERNEGISASRHENANLHYISYIRTLLSKKLRLDNIKKVNHPDYPKCHEQENYALDHIESHDRELKKCFETRYAFIMKNEEPMKRTQRMILDRLNKLKKQLNDCALGKSNDDFYNCVNSLTDDIVLLYQFSIRDNVDLKIDGQTMSMPPRADLNVAACYTEIDKKFEDQVLPNYERASECYRRQIRI